MKERINTRDRNSDRANGGVYILSCFVPGWEARARPYTKDKKTMKWLKSDERKVIILSNSGTGT